MSSVFQCHLRNCDLLFTTSLFCQPSLFLPTLFWFLSFSAPLVVYYTHISSLFLLLFPFYLFIIISISFRAFVTQPDRSLSNLFFLLHPSYLYFILTPVCGAAITCKAELHLDTVTFFFSSSNVTDV